MYYDKVEMAKIVQDHLFDVSMEVTGEKYSMHPKVHDLITHISVDIIDLLEKYIDEEDSKPSNTWSGN
jgi:hypothetical protein